MAQYILQVNCFRAGVWVAGGEQARGEYDDDEKAIQALVPKAFPLRRIYNLVEVTIVAAGGSVVHRTSIY